MSDSDSDIGNNQTFSYADKCLYRSFIKLFCNHLHEHPDGSGALIFNLQLERFGAYESNNEAIKDILHDAVRAFGASVFFLTTAVGETPLT